VSVFFDLFFHPHPYFFVGVIRRIDLLAYDCISRAFSASLKLTTLSLFDWFGMSLSISILLLLTINHQYTHFLFRPWVFTTTPPPKNYELANADR